MELITPVTGRRWLRAWLPRGRTLPEVVWWQRHRGILVLLWLHAPAVFAFALVRSQGVAHAAFEAGIVAALAAMATVSRRHPLLAMGITSVGLMTASAELVHLSDGLIEMHFHYFVMVGVVTLYQDWRPFLIAIGYVVLQHGVAGAIDPSAVYNHPAAIADPWRWAAIHGTFILGMSMAGIITWRLNESLIAAATARENQLAEAQELAQLGSWEWRADGGATWSDEMYRLLGVDAGFDTSGAAVSQLVHPDDREAWQADMDRSLEEGGAHDLDFRIVRPDGVARWLHGRGEVTEWRDGQPVVMSGTVQDITDRRISEDALRVSEGELRDTLSLLSATLDATADGILVVDLEGRITSYNDRFVEMWHIPRFVLEARDDRAALTYVLDQLVDPDSFVAKVTALYSQPEAVSLDTIQFRDGRVVERFSQAQRVGGQTVGRVWSFRDVTERSRLESELAHQAFHDSLTSLANQALFRDRLDHALTRMERRVGAQLAVLFLDLDHFKNVNDSLGHTAGDQLLVAVTERLQGCIRPADTAARLGGDEFAVLLEDLDSLDDATDIADRIIIAMRQPFTIAEREIFMSGSIGIAGHSEEIEADQLLRNADLAMYTAKRLGRNRHELFAPEMHAAALERIETEADLRRACERGELRLQYQPIVSLPTGEMVGVEALVRWQHPERGLLPPGTFIQLAEDCGLIEEIGRWTLHEACARARQWQVHHPMQPPLTVSVNLSPRQLRDPGLVEDVAVILRGTELEPSCLTLEITEGAMMHDTEVALRQLRALKALGVRLAVDDFGTGYSSLGYLQQFPIDVVKIDRTFVESIESGPGDASLAKAIVRLAESLHLTTVAEGVEHPGQAARLVEIGCPLAQGYLWSPPVDGDDIDGLLAGKVLSSSLSPTAASRPPKPVPSA